MFLREKFLMAFNECCDSDGPVLGYEISEWSYFGQDLFKESLLSSRLRQFLLFRGGSKIQTASLKIARATFAVVTVGRQLTEVSKFNPFHNNSSWGTSKFFDRRDWRNVDIWRARIQIGRNIINFINLRECKKKLLICFQASRREAS